MGTNFAPLIADLFLYCYEKNFMMSLSDDTQAEIEAFNSTSRYLDDLLNIDNLILKKWLVKFIPPINKANTAHTEASFLELYL